MGRISKTGLATAAAPLGLTAVALGLTTAELEPKAEEWAGKTCTAALLTSRSKKAGQEVATCYALKEAQALRASVASLEANQTAAPENFVFAKEATVTKGSVSPTLEAGNYGRIVISGENTGAGLSHLEASSDAVTWLRVEG